VVFSFPIMHSFLGIALTFALYAFVCLLGFVYVYYLMPETKSLSLEAIENYIMAGRPLKRLGRL
jgi:hypothetical protein